MFHVVFLLLSHNFLSISLENYDDSKSNNLELLNLKVTYIHVTIFALKTVSLAMFISLVVYYFLCRYFY